MQYKYNVVQMQVAGAILCGGVLVTLCVGGIIETVNLACILSMC